MICIQGSFSCHAKTQLHVQKPAYLEGPASDDIRHAQLCQGGVDIQQLMHTHSGRGKALRDLVEV